MRILLTVTNYPPLSGGLGVYSQRLAETFVDLGHEVSVLTLAGKDIDAIDADGVRVVKLPRRFGYRDVFAMPWGKSSIARITEEINKADVVNAHTRYFPLTQMSVAIARRAGVPVIITEHGGGYVSSSSIPTRFGARIVDITLGRRALQRASGVLAVSKTSQNFIKDLSGVESTIVGNGIDVIFWSRSKAIGESELARNQKTTKYVVFAGRLVPEKGWRRLLDAWGLLSKETREGFSLVFLGDGPDLSELRGLVLRRGLDDAVVMGNQPPQVLRDLICRGVLVNPSWAAEGFQTTLLEARALGAYVISSPVGGAAETIENANLGVILDSRNNHDWATALAEALPRAGQDVGQGNIEDYRWPQVAARYLRLFSNQLGVSVS
jgi:glycosyltransferase involved in cell wall biosynthesis